MFKKGACWGVVSSDSKLFTPFQGNVNPTSEVTNFFPGDANVLESTKNCKNQQQKKLPGLCLSQKNYFLGVAKSVFFLVGSYISCGFILLFWLFDLSPMLAARSSG